ncbi:MAG: transglycosylase SLT domain-containing protein [Lachnospiraceae bacterium]|nr:transglycosylase SLT domain-containing protein [Lachnospiraceae bacterium]
MRESSLKGSLMFIIALIGILAMIFCLSTLLCADEPEEIEEEPTLIMEVVTMNENSASLVTDTATDVYERKYYDVPLSQELQDYIMDYAEYLINCTSVEGISVPLIFVIIEVESNFKEDAVSSTEDYGLMQVNVIHIEKCRTVYGVDDLLDPYQNIKAGVEILCECLNEADGDVKKALIFYNCGITGGKKLWESGTHDTHYTDKVLAAMDNY